MIFFPYTEKKRSRFFHWCALAVLAWVLTFGPGCKSTTEAPEPPPAAPNVVLTPSPVYFGQIPAGSYALREVQLFNNGSEAITLQNIGLTDARGNVFTIAGGLPELPLVLAPLNFLTLTLRFQPASEGDFQAVLKVDLAEASFQDTLQGIGLAQSGPGATFERIIGSVLEEGAGSIALSPDGGFLLAGSGFAAQESEFADLLVIKTDPLGAEQWRTFQGGSESDGASGIALVADGSALIVGNTQSFGAGGQDGYLIKVDAAGQVLWSKTFGGPEADQLTDIFPLSNGDFILLGAGLPAGTTTRDAWAIRVDASGQMVWEKYFGLANNGDIFYAGLETDQQNLVLVGSTASGETGDLDILLVGMDLQGNELWHTTIGVTGEEMWEEAFDVVQDAQGNLLLCGYTSSKGAGGRDVYLLKTDPAGTLLWEQTFGQAQNESASSLCLDDQGNIYLSGWTIARVTQQTQFTDGYLLKVAPDGTLLWQKTFGRSSNETLGQCLLVGDGTLATVGTTTSFSKSGDVYFLKLNLEGNFGR